MITEGSIVRRETRLLQPNSQRTALLSSVLEAVLSAPKLNPMTLSPQEQASSESSEVTLQAVGDPPSELKKNHKKEGCKCMFGRRKDIPYIWWDSEESLGLCGRVRILSYIQVSEAGEVPCHMVNENLLCA